MVWDKEAAMKKLKYAISHGEVDKDVINILNILNSIDGIFTTSSCSGRANLIMMDSIGDKKGAISLQKTHVGLDRESIMNTLIESDINEDSIIFLNIEPPIFHITATDRDIGMLILRKSRECGFKNSSIKHISEKGYRMELLSTELLHIPIAYGNDLLFDMDGFEKVISLCNMTLDRGKSKLKKLEFELISLNIST